MNEENKMYEYLLEHNYVSKNENKNPLRQQELSKERAECIANKYNNLLKEEQNNWNELKKWLEDYIKATEEDYKQTSTEECIKTQKTIIAVSKNMLREMQELEQGKDE